MHIRTMKRKWNTLRRDPAALVLVSFIVLVIIGLIVQAILMDRRNSVDPASTRPLLDVIARAESRGNYNAHFGNAGNSRIDFTNMTVAEVQAWQAEYIRAGNASSAVGRYQIINTTLAGLVREMDIAPSARFDKQLQDRMALHLLKRRGAEAFVNNEISREQFAAQLAQEWAGLPRVLGGNPEESYYAGDGLNESLVETNIVLQAVSQVRAL